jgi:hypothetical protein
MLLLSNCRYSFGVDLSEVFPVSRIKKDFAFPPLAALLLANSFLIRLKMALRVLLIETVGAISLEISDSFKVYNLICYLTMN